MGLGFGLRQRLPSIFRPSGCYLFARESAKASAQGPSKHHSAMVGGYLFHWELLRCYEAQTSQRTSKTAHFWLATRFSDDWALLAADSNGLSPLGNGKLALVSLNTLKLHMWWLPIATSLSGRAPLYLAWSLTTAKGVTVALVCSGGGKQSCSRRFEGATSR